MNRLPKGFRLTSIVRRTWAPIRLHRSKNENCRYTAHRLQATAPRHRGAGPVPFSAGQTMPRAKPQPTKRAPADRDFPAVQRF